ncbi:MAG: MFS transporter [Chloroflexi bacterium]|nr:MFS transporter [Chloroflexota bacterium]
MTRVTPSGMKVLGTVALGNFMSGMTNNSVYTVLPLIAEAFDSTLALTGWVILTYQLTISCLLLFVGRLADIIGPRRIYISGFVVYTLASASCTVAPTIGWLIAARALQGIGASMLMATSPGIVVASVPPEQRGRAMGLLSAAVYLGLSTGPGLGGIVAYLWGWRVAFALNIPVGLLALALAARTLPRDRPEGQRVSLDYSGGAVFFFGLGSTLLGVTFGQQWGWTSPSILGLLAVGTILLPLFVWWEARTPRPMLDLTLFRSRLFAAATVSALLHYLSMAVVNLLAPFYLITARGLDPASAGLRLMAMPVAMVVMAPLSGTISDRIGTRAPATLGALFMVAGMASLSMLPADGSPDTIMWRLALAGLGAGLFTSPNNAALMGAAPSSRRGIAGGVMAAARMVGFVIGVAGAGAALAVALAARGATAPGLGAVTVAALDDAFRVMLVPALLCVLTSMARGAEGRSGDDGSAK